MVVSHAGVVLGSTCFIGRRTSTFHVFSLSYVPLSRSTWYSQFLGFREALQYNSGGFLASPITCLRFRFLVFAKSGTLFFCFLSSKIWTLLSLSSACVFPSLILSFLWYLTRCCRHIVFSSPSFSSPTL